MALSQGAFPYIDENGKTKVYDGDQSYDVDPNGQVITPNGPEVPWWGQSTPTAQSTQPKPAQPQPSLATPSFGGMPSLDIAPGLSSQQWDATYTLNLATEKRLRELMETVQQPQARLLIDQAIQIIKQQGFQNETGIYESQMKNTGTFPRWLPQQPDFQPGAWQQYQPGGMVAPPGAGMGATLPTMNDDQAAQVIWNARQDIQGMYRSEHPDWQPAQAIKDWWRFAPHEGTTTLADYARIKGYLAA